MSDLAAGHELDARVGTEVMGFVAVGYYGPRNSHTMHTDYDRFDTWPEAMERYREHWPNKDSWPGSAYLCHWQEGWGPLYVSDFSTDISAAWEVVDKMGERNEWRFSLDETHKGWAAIFGRAGDVTLGEDFWVQFRSGYESTAPLAICRAALAAVGALSAA